MEPVNDRYLTDARWELVRPLLPGKPGDPGCSGRDNRLFLESVLWIARNRSPWRNLPPEFGKWYTSYTRFRRWEKRGVWPRVFAALRSDENCEFFLADGEIHWSPRLTVTEDGEPANRAAA